METTLVKAENMKSMQKVVSVENWVKKFDKRLKQIASNNVKAETADMPIVKKCVTAMEPISDNIKKAYKLLNDVDVVDINTLANVSKLVNESAVKLAPIEKKFRKYDDLYFDIKNAVGDLAELIHFINGECTKLESQKNS